MYDTSVADQTQSWFSIRKDLAFKRIWTHCPRVSVMRSPSGLNVNKTEASIQGNHTRPVTRGRARGAFAHTPAHRPQRETKTSCTLISKAIQNISMSAQMSELIYMNNEINVRTLCTGVQTREPMTRERLPINRINNKMQECTLYVNILFFTCNQNIANIFYPSCKWCRNRY